MTFVNTVSVQDNCVKPAQCLAASFWINKTYGQVLNYLYHMVWLSREGLTVPFVILGNGYCHYGGWIYPKWEMDMSGLMCIQL